MKKISLSLLLFILPLLSFPQEPETFFPSSFDSSLSLLQMTPEDIRFRADYEDIDSFRLSIITDLIKNPLKTPYISYSLAKSIGDSSLSLESIFENAAEAISISLPHHKREMKIELKEDEEIRSLRKKMKNLSPSLVDASLSLFVTLKQANSLLEQAFSNLTNEEVKLLKDSLPVLLISQSDMTEREPQEQDRYEKEMDSFTARILSCVQKVDRSKVLFASCLLAKSIDREIPILKLRANDYSSLPLFSAQTSLGEFIIGGINGDTYRSKPALLIELGGNDEYLNSLSADDVRKTFISLCIDISGNDKYISSSPFSFGSGFLGLGFLIDISGNDTYQSSNFAQGSGLLGVGFLEDREGDDRYTADLCSQGAGMFGLGVLIDRKGNDNYDSRFFSQGFGFCAGLGIIVDRNGNDTYNAGGKYLDINRYFDHYLSLSQGFGFGLRPTYSGGIGILYDMRGQDLYISDIFGQGSSYWFSLGALIDESGNDRYVSHQYAQGSGVHLGLACLLDFDGDDSYISKGVSQGCGHDFSLGFLFDKKGNDTYISTDLSQGAGSANGVGIQIDKEGKDRYISRDNINTQGYGNPRRDFGSIGIFLDLKDEDFYQGPGKDDKIWTSGKWGIGIDKNSNIKNHP